MLSAFGVTLAVLIWLGVLFAVALWGERHGWAGGRASNAAYALSLAVYCTSWTFYGTVAQGAHHGWWLPPTFLGTILLYLLARPFLQRLLSTAKSVNATSVADFIASRLGQSGALAALITGVVVVGMLPYIALQLKAVAMSYTALVASSSEPPAWQDSAFYVAVVMALFAMLFGTRRISSTQANRGLITAMAFEALFKLGAMLAAGVFVSFFLFAGPQDLWQQWQALPRDAVTPRPLAYATLAALGVMAMFTLPHQFHVGVVECADKRQIDTARWMFPLFLLLISLPIWPLAAAGTLKLAELGVPADLYILALALDSGSSALTLLVLLGGIAAASGMVIMASLSISIMIGNHWATPWLLRRGWPERSWLTEVRNMRRVGIVAILALGYGYSRALASLDSLADIGAQSFSAISQLAPAVWIAVYRPTISARAVGAGIVAGFVLWAYVLIAPLLLPAWSADVRSLLWSPEGLWGLSMLDPLSRAVWGSLGLNLAVLALVQWLAPGSARAQQVMRLSQQALLPIARRFLDEDRVHQLFAADRGAARLDADVESRVAHELTAVIGAASTRMLLDAARAGSDQQIEQVASILGEAAQAARFSQQVLGAALENMTQGISVVDADLRLVAWNRRYAEMFQVPADLLQIGRPIEDLIRHAAGVLGDEGSADASVDRRLAHLRAGTAHLSERLLTDGSIVEIRGKPMLGGGFVTTFTDVTEFRRNEQALTGIAETLEQRVHERTAAAETARAEAEQANLAKSRLLAAITHDLAQPLNAARLFGHALVRRAEGRAGETGSDRQDVHNLLGAIESAEGLLGGLMDISRLGAGAMTARFTGVRVDALLEPLAAEFRMLAAERGLELRYRPSSAWVRSDAQMLRRVIQNFLANAVRYTERGAILLGCRRRRGRVAIEVWDSGSGIAVEDQLLIFEEFRRLDKGGRGLGLGLAIAERMARLLDAPITLRSVPGQGSVFAIELPRAEAEALQEAERPIDREPPSMRVMVIDNDAAVLQGMRSMLESWGCSVGGARTRAEAERLQHDFDADMLMIDYHLDGGDTGLALRQAMPARLRSLPCVLITADHDPSIRAAAEAEGCTVLYKPLKPLALKSVMARHRRSLLT